MCLIVIFIFSPLFFLVFAFMGWLFSGFFNGFDKQKHRMDKRKRRGKVE